MLWLVCQGMTCKKTEKKFKMVRNKTSQSRTQTKRINWGVHIKKWKWDFPKICKPAKQSAASSRFAMKETVFSSVQCKKKQTESEQ